MKECLWCKEEYETKNGLTTNFVIFDSLKPITMSTNRPLSKMTWEEVFAEMSIAGSPGKIVQLGRDVMDLITQSLDATNRAELTNVELMLKRAIAEIRLLQRLYDQTH